MDFTSRGHRETAWDRATSYAKEDRPLQPVKTLVIKGKVDVVFHRVNEPTLVVAGENAEAIASVRTYYQGNKLVIEREGVTITTKHSTMVFHGSVGSFVVGDIVNGKPTGHTFMGLPRADVVVGIGLSAAPRIQIVGSGDIELCDVEQSLLELDIQGSGDISVDGQVDQLDIEIAGSGDVDASLLQANKAHLSIAGSGDIEALVTSQVRARVAGSGDIVIRGNPPLRDHSVAGSGKIKFR